MLYGVRWALSWLVNLSAGMLLLMTPAIYNQFPLVFYDTGGYIERWLDHSVTIGRSLAYGLFVGLSAGGLSADSGSLWGTVAVQSAFSIWVIHLTARAVLGENRPIPLTLTLATLAIFTGLPWYTGQIMPDIMEPLMVLALYLLAFRAEQLGRGERAGLVGLVLLAVASHMAFLALGLGLLIAILLCRAATRRPWPDVNVGLPILGVCGGIGALLAVNLLVAGYAGFTPGGQTFMFARMIENGVAQRFLDDNCPTTTAFRICAYRQSLPKSAESWIWSSDSPLRQIGGWDKGADEMGRIIRGSLAAYPLAHLEAALTATMAQLGKVATADGLDQNDFYHADWVIETRLPVANVDYLASLQKRHTFHASLLNLYQVPVALLALPLTIIITVWVSLIAKTKILSPLAALGGFTAVAVLSNAMICGALSGPVDRYQNRLIWIAVLFLILAFRHFIAIKRINYQSQIG